MAAPYGPQLSFNAFRTILETRHKCTFSWVVPIADVRDIDGTPSPGVGCFQRIDQAGKTWQAIIVIFMETQKMTRTLLRSTCARLHIDSDTFHQYLQ